MNNICTHIIARDKFTSGYINFLKRYSFGYEHHFITFKGNYSLETDNEDNLYILNDYSEVYPLHTELLERSRKIVIASFFDDALNLLKMPQKLWDKTWIQFWGGDIYRFRSIRTGLINRSKQLIVWSLVRKAIRKSAGVLTLVEGDYSVIEDVFRIKKPHYVVQVPDDFYIINHYDYETILSNNRYSKAQIIIGNSATQENRHEEIYELLHNKDIKDTEIVVPLSYGDDEYRKELIDKGKLYFGRKFIPVTDFMKREEYIGMLAKTSVGIFNNDRQQATGNIIIMFNLGKKIYLRKGTTMWDFFTELGFTVHDVKEINNIDIDSILHYDEAEKNSNYLALEKMENEGIEQWKQFLERND